MNEKIEVGTLSYLHIDEHLTLPITINFVKGLLLLYHCFTLVYVLCLGARQVLRQIVYLPSMFQRERGIFEEFRKSSSPFELRLTTDSETSHHRYAQKIRIRPQRTRKFPDAAAKVKENEKKLNGERKSSKNIRRQTNRERGCDDAFLSEHE